MKTELIRTMNRPLFWLVNTLLIIGGLFFCFYVDCVLAMDRSFWEPHESLFNFLESFSKIFMFAVFITIVFINPYKKLFCSTVNVEYYENKVRLKGRFINREIYYCDVKEVYFKAIRRGKMNGSKVDRYWYTYGFSMTAKVTGSKNLYLCTPLDGYYPCVEVSGFYELYQKFNGQKPERNILCGLEKIEQHLNDTSFKFGVPLITPAEQKEMALRSQGLVFPSFDERYDSILYENAEDDTSSTIDLNSVKKVPNKITLCVFVVLCIILTAFLLFSRELERYMRENFIYLFVAVLFLVLGFFILIATAPQILTADKNIMLKVIFYADKIVLCRENKNLEYDISIIKNAFLIEKEDLFKEYLSYRCLRLNFTDGTYKDFLLGSFADRESEKEFICVAKINLKCRNYKGAFHGE